ncbi:MAG TPA: hypothetical protein VE129_15685 [Thermoanaerobaculia bacterium]|nr:hypothetical protein [Thermoanaerobaculia bacterium]
MRMEVPERGDSNVRKHAFPPGGRGIHLVRGLSSSFSWRRDGSRNVVVVEFTVP